MFSEIMHVLFYTKMKERQMYKLFSSHVWFSEESSSLNEKHYILCQLCIKYETKLWHEMQQTALWN